MEIIDVIPAYRLFKKGDAPETAKKLQEELSRVVGREWVSRKGPSLIVRNLSRITFGWGRPAQANVSDLK